MGGGRQTRGGMRRIPQLKSHNTRGGRGDHRGKKGVREEKRLEVRRQREKRWGEREKEKGGVRAGRGIRKGCGRVLCWSCPGPL